LTLIEEKCLENKEIEMNLLVDYLRGTRIEKEGSSKSLFEKLQKNIEQRNTENTKNFPNFYFFLTPAFRGIWKKILPNRFNETLGVQHIKLYLFDDKMIISGANLSKDYFTNRFFTLFIYFYFYFFVSIFLLFLNFFNFYFYFLLFFCFLFIFLINFYYFLFFCFFFINFIFFFIFIFFVPKRQDRYVEIQNEKLCDFYWQFLHLVAQNSFSLQNNELIAPKYHPSLQSQKFNYNFSEKVQNYFLFLFIFYFYLFFIFIFLILFFFKFLLDKKIF
jgi:hypothetical protein